MIKYIISYPIALIKFKILFTNFFLNFKASIKVYLQSIMLIHIKNKYFAFVFSIQKE